MRTTRPPLRQILFPLLFVCVTASTSATAGLFSSPQEDAEELEEYKTALKVEIDGLRRGQDVLFPLEKAATKLCGSDAAWSYGLELAGRNRFKGDLREAAPLLGYDKQVGVLYVAKGSPAAEAGLAAGDVVSSIDGVAAETGADAYESAERQIKRQAENGAPLSISILRNGASLQFTLQPVQVCNYKLQIIRNSVVNAATTGWTIRATTGLLDFTQDDAELATVLSHEIAHSLMGHVRKKFGNLALGMVADTAVATGVMLAGGPIAMAGGLLINAIEPGAQIGAHANSQGFELEADYVGLYITALAGYPTDGAAMLWRRMAVENPQFINSGYWSTHPSTPERMLLLEDTSRQINAKVASGSPLLPDLESRFAAWERGDK